MKKSLEKVLFQSNMIDDPSPASSEQDGQPQFSPNFVEQAAVANGQPSGKKIMTLLNPVGATKDNIQLDSAAIPNPKFSDPNNFLKSRF